MASQTDYRPMQKSASIEDLRLQRIEIATGDFPERNDSQLLRVSTFIRQDMILSGNKKLKK